MRYEVATLSCSPLGVETASARAREWLENSAGGTLLGVWRSDIGSIAQLLILRSFQTDAELAKERERALLSEDPFGSKSEDIPLKMETYAPFPFLPEISSADLGGTFEFRTYYLKPGGLPGTIAGWERAIGPAHAYTRHLVINMYALDGEPRILHIWGFSSIEERNRLRKEHFAAGLWPPEGGPERIARATSIIAYSEPNLPIV